MKADLVIRNADVALASGFIRGGVGIADGKITAKHGVGRYLRRTK